MWFFKQLAAASMLGRLVLANPSSATTASFSKNVRFLFDVDGNQIDGFGVKISFFEGKYYFYGNAFADSRGDFSIGSYQLPHRLWYQVLLIDLSGELEVRGLSVRPLFGEPL
jgi:hypothetical protein